MNLNLEQRKEVRKFAKKLEETLTKKNPQWLTQERKFVQKLDKNMSGFSLR